MHLAYSAIGTTNNNPQNGTTQHEPENEQLLRYLAYQSTCEKFSREIAAIQKYLPGWKPEFR
ncbi:hypothetical protein KXD93_11745 [Mucilaginibacter sp. BJC16-A38]|uniref:hypothetical protein n=1 Tax=Mucilaginibacter phenanthrenivorans TaxID=1234842 RepID=UPI002157806D|nr:hypothetical protein [Mucilaginibacter phenanthrenivorans]MCR8558324.1 hypothetical protein [Mucilaginibacter phenanthrenivorans]